MAWPVFSDSHSSAPFTMAVSGLAAMRHLGIGLICIITFVVLVPSLVLSYLLLLLFLRYVVISNSVF